MTLSAISSRIAIQRIARLPLDLLPRNAVVPILGGGLRGKLWIIGAGVYRCWFGLYEYRKQQLIVRQVRPGSVFYDVGANVGFYTLLASALVRSGKVFSFEPVPRNLCYLKRHLEINRIVNVQVLEMALSDANGMSSFAAEETGFMGHLSDDGGLRVVTVTLDSLVEDRKILPPDYVKMDIEGAELHALRGARETFRRHRPMLFLATHGRETGQACCELLKSWGYGYHTLEGDSQRNRAEIVAAPRT